MRFDDQRALTTAIWRTWGARGLARRASYELTKRTGSLVRAEQQWAAEATAPNAPLRPVGITLPGAPTPPDAALVQPDVGIRLYGALVVAASTPPDWHRHPISGHRFDATRHWSLLSDADPDAGDIKDVWELSRLGWLHPWLHQWAVTGAPADAERIWRVIEHWHAANPPYLGPNWMCGQETSIRTIGVMFLADALRSSDASDERRQLLVAEMVQDAVGRVAPTLGYALSQRNNHASSEAGFLWTASILAPWLPAADELRRRAARALTEVAADQFAPDGSYAQHSPTYQRVALHVLLWCLAVARGSGVKPPPGVSDAVHRSVGHLKSLVAPGSDGRMPNLGGNDGALVFDLAPRPITDFRPVLTHAAAATGAATPWGTGPWDEEAAWFGLSPPPHDVPATPRRTSVGTHALTRGTAHAVLRAGPIQHRPAHGDQLHLDVWLAGSPVAVDAGSYRYTAPPPWGNALAGEEVHNLPRVIGVPQAVRSGRFFWKRWTEAVARIDQKMSTATAELELAEGTVLHRRVVVHDRLVVVTDWSIGRSAEVRWNLVDATGATAPGRTELTGPGWQGLLVHPGTSRLVERSPDDPSSGWAAPTYGVRTEVSPVIASTSTGEPVISAFATDTLADRLDEIVAAARDAFDQRTADDTRRSSSSTFDARSRRS